MPRKPGTRDRLKAVLPIRYGEDFAPLLDGRCRLSRTMRERFNALVADLGGNHLLSHAQRSLVRRAVMLELVVEHEEARLASGAGIDIQPHVQLVGSLLAIYKVLGLKRREPPQPSLSDFIAAHSESSETTHAEAKNHGRGDM